MFLDTVHTHRYHPPKKKIVSYSYFFFFFFLYLFLLFSLSLIHCDDENEKLTRARTCLGSLCTVKEKPFVRGVVFASPLQVRKEYRKFVRRHSWLPKCLRCSKTVAGSSGGSSGTSGGGGGANGGKDFGSHNTSSNPSAPTTDSSGLSPHAASNVGTTTTTSPPNNHNNLTAACNNTNLSINVNLNNLSLRSPVGAHQMHMMAPSNHNRHPAQQGIR